MRAAVVHDFTEPLRIEERAVPVAGAGQVLVRIETSGLCHVLSGTVDARLVFDLR